MKWVWRGFLVVFVLVLLAGGGSYLWLRSSLPKTDGTLALPGLSAPVTIGRDDRGIVQIRAETEADAYFALGFAHAQDRLFQMDFMRRLGAGRLSEVIGAAALGTDRLMRTLGLYRLAETNLPYLAPEVQAALTAYSAGVNAFLDHRSGALPPEFQAFWYSPEPWQPTDSLVWGRLMALHLSNNWRNELLRQGIAQHLTAEQLEFLWPALPDGAGQTEVGWLPDSVRGIDDHLLGRAAHDLAVLPHVYGASNSWAVDGRRTASGAPLLANDPHLGLTAPIQWYLARIETPTLTITGGTAPGVPFTLVGHNGRVAWGFTTTHSDTQDLFVEQVAPNDPNRYLTPAGAKPFEQREEVIRVRGGANIALTVRATDHGPVVSDADMAAVPGQVLALAWPGFRADDLTAQAIYRMNHAADADSFYDALRDFHSPQQNIVYAAEDGTIGFVAAGRVPVRKALFAGSQVPAPGWTGAYDWTGFLPFEDLPKAIDPSAGWIATANNDIRPEGYPHFLTARWEEPYRARRIAELLDGKTSHTADGMAAMQLDIVSLAARELLPPMLAAARGGASRHEAVLRRLGRWDFRMDRTRPEPLIFLTWLGEANRRIFTDELGVFYADYGPWNLEKVGSVLDTEESWCDNIATEAEETCPEQFAAALDDAQAALAEAYGDDPGEWRWGEAHQAHFPHPVLEAAPVIGRWLETPVATDGDSYTLNRGTPRIRPGSVTYPHVHGPGLRAVFDFADLDHSQFIIATGQSGNPLSPHYADLVPRWRDGEFLTIVGETKQVLTLRPTQR
ncbi:penicillin acylase family protein [Rhodospirillaceae bacterium SYSU D60014]|uniref:penicillin acylase family protein n=1 Tax=Virgifigura deserti TaxID=2268457 RepID=UPI000E673385